MKELKKHKSFGGWTQFWEHDSKVTGTPMKFSTYLPTEKPEGCLIWLSGLTCNEENFITKAGAQAHLAGSKMMVVCPDTSPRGLDLKGEHDSYDFGSGAGFYVNATTEGYKDHYRMDEYITSEFYQLLQKEFGVGKNIALSGHSMGGHGALVLGLRNPELFKSLSAFSPIVHPTACPWGEKAFTGYLGDNKEAWRSYDACELLKDGKAHAHEILVDQGTADDFLKEQLRTDDLINTVKETGQKANIRYQEGYDHSYYFIATFIKDHIEHHRKALGL